VFLVRAPDRSAPAQVEAPAPVDAAAETNPVMTGGSQRPEASGPLEQDRPVSSSISPAYGGASEEGHTQSPPPDEVRFRSEDRPRLVLIADPDEDRGKASEEAVRRWGLIPHRVQDGVEAMLAIQRTLPRAVVLDAALPRMFGFEVCEIVKRNESLRDTLVVLVGSVQHQTRYRRDSTDLYGADVYVEQPDLPEGLRPILRENGLPVDGVPSEVGPGSSSVAMPERSADPSPVAMPEPEPETDTESLSPARGGAAETSSFVEGAAASGGVAPSEGEGGDPETLAERERALRLARIAVSEMILYQPDKFDEALRAGDLEQALDLEIQEAKALLRQRVREDVREETDFVLDELRRVAEERSREG